jgi:hypothetical protein
MDGRTEEKRNTYTVLVAKPEVRNHLEDVGIHRMIILKWVLKK